MYTFKHKDTQFCNGHLIILWKVVQYKLINYPGLSVIIFHDKRLQ